MSTIPAIVQASHSADATLIPTTNEAEGISPSAYESPSGSASTANTPTMMRKNATRRFLAHDFVYVAHTAELRQRRFLRLYGGGFGQRRLFR